MNNVKDEYNVDNNVLLVFHYKQYGWHGTEVLRYNDLREAKDDLRKVARYGVESNKFSNEEGMHKLYDDYMKNVENSKIPRFSIEGKRESFQVEIIPYRSVAGDNDDLNKVCIIHHNGNGYDFSNEYFNNFNTAKKVFFKFADKCIDEELERKDISNHSACMRRITLDEYKKLGRYSWGYMDNGEHKTFKLLDYKIMDARKNKEKWLDVNANLGTSNFLKIIDAYGKNERYFVTDIERRMADDDERYINGKFGKEKLLEKKYIKDEKKEDNPIVYTVHRNVKGDGYNVEDSFDVKSFQDGCALLRRMMYRDFDKYECSSAQRKKVHDAFLKSMVNKPVRYEIKIPADEYHKEIVIRCVLDEGRSFNDEKLTSKTLVNVNPISIDNSKSKERSR